MVASGRLAPAGDVYSVKKVCSSLRPGAVKGRNSELRAFFSEIISVNFMYGR